jgi:hypothetical protein
MILNANPRRVCVCVCVVNMCVHNYENMQVDRGGQTKFGLSAKFTPPLSI